MDLQSAYDSVWHAGLHEKLRTEFNLDGNFLHFLKTYLSRRYNRVLLDDYQTPWHLHDQGLPQGGPMMPILWTLFINDYKIKNKGMKLVAFADDMSLYTLTSELLPETTYKLQDEIDNFYQWTLDWKLVINAEKCNTISLTHRNDIKSRVYHINQVNMECVHPPQNPPDVCAHNPLCLYGRAYQLSGDENSKELVTSNNITTPSRWKMKKSDPHTIPLFVRILGLYFDPRLEWKEHVQQIIKRCKTKIYQLARILRMIITFQHVQ